MTSLFDHAGLPGGLSERPIELFTDVAIAGRRPVMLLEFMAVDERRDPAPEAGVEQAPRQPAEEEHAEAQRAHQIAVMIDAAREEARAEERKANAERMEADTIEQRARLEQMSREFARDRARYFAAAEEQVVKLALAIARRVLAREVMSDPLHLAASVRAALAKLQDASMTTLRVSGADLAAWRTLFAPSEPDAITVIEDRNLPSGHCVMETPVGRIELSVPVQFEEIERSFAELMQAGAENGMEEHRP
jgi:flagellar assembly protein FliH